MNDNFKPLTHAEFSILEKKELFDYIKKLTGAMNSCKNLYRMQLEKNKRLEEQTLSARNGCKALKLQMEEMQQNNFVIKQEKKRSTGNFYKDEVNASEGQKVFEFFYKQKVDKNADFFFNPEKLEYLDDDIDIAWHAFLQGAFSMVDKNKLKKLEESRQYKVPNPEIPTVMAAAFVKAKT